MTGWRDETNPYAAPGSGAAETAPAVDLIPAARWRRLLAFVIDAALVYLIVLVLSLVLRFVALPLLQLALPPNGLVLKTSEQRWLVGLILLGVLGATLIGSIVAIGGYFVALEGSPSGATLGKRLLRIRVVGIDGRPIGVGRAAWRTAVKFLISVLPYFLGSFWAFFNTRRRTLHDLLAGTMVIRSDIQRD